VPAKAPVERILVKEPADCLPALLPYRNASTERLLVITLDGSGRIIRVHEVTRGLVDRAVVHPREVFKVAVEDLAVGIIVAHNHPSGNFDPSPADLVSTRRLVEASKIMGIRVLDHMVISKEGFKSIRESYRDYFEL
jgi:DNA repair protein RadC